jgi:acetyltransferase-like isoleucine patch superfamily enzyme
VESTRASTSIQRALPSRQRSITRVWTPDDWPADAVKRQACRSWIAPKGNGTPNVMGSPLLGYDLVAPDFIHSGIRTVVWYRIQTSLMRDALKTTARGAAFVCVLPSLVSYMIRSNILGRDRALHGSTQLLSLCPGVVGQYLRQAFLARTIGHCAPTATISFGTVFSKAGTFIEDRAYIGVGCYIGLAHIGRDVLIGSGVHVTSGSQTHGTADPSRPIREQEGQMVMVKIGAGAWIGSAAVIMADVGENSVIGAGAVVTKAIPDSVVAAGVPATVLKSRA